MLPHDNVYDPRLDPSLQHFYANPAIAALGRQSRWTISGILGDVEDPKNTAKAPIDARHLIDYHRVRGAWATDEQCLVTLDELSSRVPTALNAAYHLNAASDGVVVLDIESTCPPDLAARLSALPGALYTETSMSGRGYHLIFPLPRSYWDDKDMAAKVVLAHPKKWFEVLQRHWTTFTRNQIDPSALTHRAAAHSGEPTPLDDLDLDSFDALYASLAQLQPKPAWRQAGGAGTLDTSKAPESLAEGVDVDTLVLRVIRPQRPALKEPADFDHDHSRYEWSVLNRLTARLDTEIRALRRLGDTHEWTPAERAYVVYRASLKALQPRHKHTTTRNGRPFLLDRAAGAVLNHDQRVAHARESQPRRRYGF